MNNSVGGEFNSFTINLFLSDSSKIKSAIPADSAVRSAYISSSHLAY